MSFRYVYVPRKPGLTFSRIEIQHILLSVGALTLAFVLVDFSPGLFGVASPDAFQPHVIAIRALAAFVAVATGFLLHELAHKAMGIRYRCWAEFRADFRGLMIGIVTALFGFVFAAPGAVHVAGRITREQEGKLGLAGPITNLMMGTLAFVGVLGMRGVVLVEWSVPHVLALILYQTAFVNFLLGAFNMIPVDPFDGSKVFRWNKVVYAGTAVALVGLFVYFFFLFR